MRNIFFIVGAPRSGTTMLQQALNRHSQVVIPPETAFFTCLKLSRAGQRDHIRRINSDLRIDLPLPTRRISNRASARALFQQLECCYLERLKREDVTHFGEKSPEHQRRLSMIRDIFPEANVILLYRDGRDVAHCLTKLPWMSPDLYVNFALWLHYYRIQKRAVADGLPGLYCVKYEDLVTNPDKELTKLLGFLGLPYESAVAQGHGNTEGIVAWSYPWKARALERIIPTRVGLWRRELSPAQIAVLERWGGEALNALGYELMTDGQCSLPWFFSTKVYLKALFWLMKRTTYGKVRTGNAS